LGSEKRCFNIEENGFHILVDNGLIGLEFEKAENGFGLSNVVNVLTGYSFMLPSEEKATLWQAEFRDAGGREHIIDNGVDCKRSYRAEETPDGNLVLQLEWSGIGLGDEKEAVDVQVSLTLKKDISLSYWRIKLSTRSEKACLWQVTFPSLSNIGATRDDPSHDLLIVPDGWGRIYRDPRTMSVYNATYPGGWNFAMQFLAFCHDRSGLYLASHDPRAYYKRFAFNPDTYTGTTANHLPQSSFQVVNFPENMGTLQPGYETPYDLVVGVFEGDWYDASQIYREWVLKNASWCRQGKLSERNDVPDWFRKIVIWCLPEADFAEKDPDEVVSMMIKFKERFDVPVALHWYNWHKIPFDTDYPEYFPVKGGFKEGVKRLQEAGVRVMPYINGRLFDFNCKSWRLESAEKYCTKESAPRLKPQTLQNYVEFYGSRQKFAVMCPYTGYWQDKIAQIVKRLVDEYGVDGVYIDQIAAAAANLCFDPNHGHPLGGGNYWLSGYEEMLRKTRERAREKRPDVILTSECNAECFMTYLDAFLTWHTFQGELVPLFPAVYGGWTITFGTFFSRDDLENPSSFAAKLGQMFVFGAQLGWFGLYEILDERHRTETEYLRKLAKYRGLGLKFLLHGRLMRPLEPEVPIPTISLRWFFFGRTVDVTLPLIMSSVWKAEDGTLGLILTNISTMPQLAVYRVCPEEYGLPAGKGYLVSRITEKGTVKMGEYESAEIPVKKLLPGRSVLMLQVETQ